MKRSGTKIIATVVSICGLFSCAQTQREVAAPAVTEIPPAATESPTANEEGFEDWSLIVDGMTIEDLLEDRATAGALLREVLDADLNDEELVALLALAKEDTTTLADLRERLGDSDRLSGIDALPIVQFLTAYVNGEQQKVRGKIRQYYFNDEEKGGYLEVDTIVETLQGGVVTETDTYFWAIAVRPPTYQVIDHSGDRDDPFPGTLPLMEPKLTEIEMRKLDQKLWAKGPGIVIIAVERNGVLLPTTNYLYTSTAASCIDMMFWGYPPRSELPIKQEAFCLGRCQHPMVVNTD